MYNYLFIVYLNDIYKLLKIIKQTPVSAFQKKELVYLKELKNIGMIANIFFLFSRERIIVKNTKINQFFYFKSLQVFFSVLRSKM